MISRIKMRVKPRMRKPLLQLILLAVLALIPVFTRNPYIIHILILSNVYAVFASSWDLISGYTGQISFGHALFFGGGAYVSAFLTMWYNVPPPLCLLIAGASMAAFSLIVGVPCLRLSGPYLAIATLAFSETVRAIIIAFPQVTHGDEGIPIRALVYGMIPNYYVSLILMFILLNVMHFIGNYRFRLPFTAIRENERVAQASGINTTKYKLLSFTISTFLAGIVGSFFSYYMMAVTPEMLSIDTTFTSITMTMVGGMGTLIGPVIGAYILSFLSELLRNYLIYRIRILIYAVLFIAFIMLMPGGTIKALSRLFTRGKSLLIKSKKIHADSR